MGGAKASLLYSPGNWGPSTAISSVIRCHRAGVAPVRALRRSNDQPQGVLVLVAVGRFILLTNLLELGLDDLNDLRVVWVRLGNADVQRSHLDELPVRSLLLDVVIKFFVERMVGGEAIVDIR